MQPNASTPPFLPLDSPEAGLDLVGGKGASLARLASAGLPVPSGFHLTTEAYRRFVAQNDLQAVILSAAGEAVGHDHASLERASVTIRALFAGGMIPEEVAAAIAQGYAHLGAGNQR